MAVGVAGLRREAARRVVVVCGLSDGVGMRCIKNGLGPRGRFHHHSRFLRHQRHFYYQFSDNSDLFEYLSKISRLLCNTTCDYEKPSPIHSHRIPQYNTLLKMVTSDRSSTSTMPEKDNMSTRSTSTIASTVALVKSMLPSKRYTKSKPAKPRSTESPMSKAEREAIHAEARYYALR